MLGKVCFFFLFVFQLLSDNNLESALRCDNLPTASSFESTEQLNGFTTPAASKSAGFKASLDAEIGQ